MPIKEDREAASETRAGQPEAARRAAEANTPDTTPDDVPDVAPDDAPDAASDAASDAAPDAASDDASDTRTLREATRPAGFSAHVFAERWSMLAGACLLIATALLASGRMDAAFVVATLGVVAWFWNERNRLRPHGIETEERLRDEERELEDRDEE